MTKPIGSYLRVYDRDGGGAWCIVEGDRHALDAAVSAWIDSGGTRDSVVYLTTTAGETACILASWVVSWITSTPEGRRRGVELEAAWKAEKDENRAAAGLPWEESE